MFHDYKIN